VFEGVISIGVSDGDDSEVDFIDDGRIDGEPLGVVMEDEESREVKYRFSGTSTSDALLAKCCLSSCIAAASVFHQTKVGVNSFKCD
jgi:hypothetical protein